MSNVNIVEATHPTAAPERKDDALHWVHKARTVALCGLGDLDRADRIPRANAAQCQPDICPLCDVLYHLLSP